jgi:AraC family transcriptional regulator, transcriptional activator of pobA
MLFMIIDDISTVDDQNSGFGFRIFSLPEDNPFNQIQRLSFHSLILISNGSTQLKADFSEYPIGQNCLLYFSPFEPFALSDARELRGVCINFHSDFFCTYKHHKEIACNDVLFNNAYHEPFIWLNDEQFQMLNELVDKMKAEMESGEFAERELIISYLKIFLINATRIKLSQYPDAVNEGQVAPEHHIIHSFKEAIEKHYKSKHSAKDYADLLCVPVNTLAKISKTHFNKTLTNLISDRIIIEAKRELYLTSKTVKQIANDLGFTDEYYFSRFFKNNAEVSPKQYRDTVGFARAEN